MSKTSRFVDTNLELRYEIDWDASAYDSEDVLQAVTDASRAFRFLQPVYEKASRAVGQKRSGLLEIRQEYEPMFTLTVVQRRSGSQADPESEIYVDLGLYEDSEDDEYGYVEPAP